MRHLSLRVEEPIPAPLCWVGACSSDFMNDNVLYHTLMNTAGDGINELIIAPSQDLRPAPLFTPTRKAARRFLEFFTAQINNAHTRRAYLNATRRFTEWCASKDIHELAQVQPFHVAAFVHDLQD
jgi:hypothetical protein